MFFVEYTHMLISVPLSSNSAFCFDTYLSTLIKGILSHGLPPTMSISKITVKQILKKEGFSLNQRSKFKVSVSNGRNPTPPIFSIPSTEKEKKTNNKTSNQLIRCAVDLVVNACTAVQLDVLNQYLTEICSSIKIKLVQPNHNVLWNIKIEMMQIQV